MTSLVRFAIAVKTSSFVQCLRLTNVFSETIGLSVVIINSEANNNNTTHDL